MTARRLLLASVATAAVAVPAAPASADPIVHCSPTFLVGPVRCAVADAETQVREDNPAVDAILQQYVDPLL